MTWWQHSVPKKAVNTSLLTRSWAGGHILVTFRAGDSIGSSEGVVFWGSCLVRAPWAGTHQLLVLQLHIQQECRVIQAEGEVI